MKPPSNGGGTTQGLLIERTSGRGTNMALMTDELRREKHQASMWVQGYRDMEEDIAKLHKEVEFHQGAK